MLLPWASSFALLFGASLASTPAAHARGDGEVTSARPKVILDNDWTTTEFSPFLQALQAGWDVVGLIGNTANSWAKQATLHALATLEIGNLTCIPVYRGADYPLLNNPGLARAWGLIHGNLPYQGAFAPQNGPLEQKGHDPSGDDPERISRAALMEGFPNTSHVLDVWGAEFLVQTVRKYPGEVTIFSAGALTNIALAHRIDPTFAKNTKGLFVMGGYMDGNLVQVTGSTYLASLQSDINLKIDPEGSKVALSAPFPSITLIGNAANQFIPSEDYLNELAEVENPYTRLMHRYYDRRFPFWDATAAAVMLDPGIVTNSTEFYVDVDTSYASPSYGTIHAYQEALKPKAQTLQKVRMVVSVDEERLKQQVKMALQFPPTCADL
ncbi:inosine-uridine preferring nucleoside hydrolase [Hirsutella rhossiliensis]|uniref:Inosine-uridine preferring nucleoside hydrolase domain-containing protein n=1 Tax=Hirsutella rhossiliensis TaxID=111463 RepID=A0A9P8N618_9HYPO|nr:inosine-uridine preferring nucleoside hydrolase domain-containing protein [Hirsutella rhossiliensis]KAH0967495.1 inosine-uridine preferring nucleoside hydrolase domain-containing protein [Hirsutella rhossiliensis]